MGWGSDNGPKPFFGRVAEHSFRLVRKTNGFRPLPMIIEGKFVGDGDRLRVRVLVRVPWFVYVLWVFTAWLLVRGALETGSSEPWFEEIFYLSITALCVPLISLQLRPLAQ